MSEFNLIAHGTDSYKGSHWNLYPPGTEIVYSYCEPRKGARFGPTTFFGLQYILKKYLTGQVVTREKIEEAAKLYAAHFGNDKIFNREGWEYILSAYGGLLPVRINAIPEGTSVKTGTCLFTIENTDRKVPWLTNYLETLLMQVWSPITVCTSSRQIKDIISGYLDLTGDSAGLSFKLHDFGYRGVSSVETAALAGAAHLVNFKGTDTMAALALVRDYYHEPMAGYSIPATEHSVMTAEGPEGEVNIVRRILATYPTGLVAMVIDSFDTFNFIENVIGGNPDILSAIRNRQGTVVFRPDSGKLPGIDLDVFHSLAKVFGVERNSKGFDVLPSQVRMIQGDGIKWLEPRFNEDSHHSVSDILELFHTNKISADNIAFGSGGGLLQSFNRDTQRFAIKCSWMQVNGQPRDVYKQPSTDKDKTSKRGRLVVIQDDDGSIYTLPEGSGGKNILEEVFMNGYLVRDQTFEDIRERATLC